MQKDKQLDVVSNADYEVFLTNGAPGYLEYAGTAQGRHVTIDVERGDMERCHRMEVRETRSGFEIHKASFERAVDWTEWRETGRERLTVEQNRQKAVESVKSAVDHVDGHERQHYEPEYFVNLEPIQGEFICHGPFKDLSEARDCFEHTYPEFDGGSVTLTKIESTIPGISPSQLRNNALREEYESHESTWGEMLSKSTTLLGRDVWDVSQDQAGLIYRHAGKRYEPSFCEEIASDLDAGYWMTPEEARSLSCDIENDASWVHSLFDEARIELGNSANQQAVLEKAKAMLYERHDYEYEMVHNGSGRSEEMPSQLSARHNQEWKEFEKQTLAEEFRQAITTAELERPLLQETTCDWCGGDVQTTKDHQVVDLAPMCNPCHDEYFPESAASRAQPLKPRGFIGKDILATIDNERSGENTQMNDAFLKAGYDAQQLRIEQLEAWIEQSITRPSMSRELRLEGLELVEARSPDIRLAVERICPSRSQGQSLEQSIER